jgi:hypothetical protein
MTIARSIVCMLVGLVCGACASEGARGTTREASNEPHPAIEHIHRSRCGACHVRVEPGTRSRAVLEKALARHVDRVHLDKADWTAMIDYLSPPDATAASAPHAVSRTAY